MISLQVKDHPIKKTKEYIYTHEPTGIKHIHIQKYSAVDRIKKAEDWYEWGRKNRRKLMEKVFKKTGKRYETL